MQANYGENEIKSLLQKVRIFNKNIGAYQLFAITSEFDYAVKLTNGRIVIKLEELQDDEQDTLTPDRLTVIANRFTSSTPTETKTQEPEIKVNPVTISETVSQTETKTSNKKSNKLMWLFISAGIVAVIAITATVINNNSSSDYYPSTTSSSTNESYSPPSNTNTYSPTPSSRPKTEDELKEELYQKESSNPLNYISVQYTWKVNLVANTILEGHVYNSATIADFKNVSIRASFYSKTDVLLGQEDFTVMEFVPAGDKTYFRHKITGWWKDATSSKYTILSAEPY